MPIYEYKCNSCGKRFEKMQKFSDEPLQIHEECGGPVERLLSAPALQFKGTGWYVTDYAKSNATVGKNGSESKKESTSESKADSSSKTSESSSTSSTNSSPSTSSSSDK